MVAEKLVLDTSVIIEYIIKNSPYKPLIDKLFEKAENNELKLYLTPITLSELLYVASRIYKAAGIKEANREALNSAYWVASITNIIHPSIEVALEAGELKKKLRLALPDCYVIAATYVLNKCNPDPVIQS